MGIPAVIFVIAGVWFTTILPSGKIQLLMNIILVVLAAYLIINFNKTLKQTNTNLYVGWYGLVFFAGLVGTGGAIQGITLTAFCLPKNVFIAHLIDRPRGRL